MQDLIVFKLLILKINFLNNKMLAKIN